MDSGINDGLHPAPAVSPIPRTQPRFLIFPLPRSPFPSREKKNTALPCHSHPPLQPSGSSLFTSSPPQRTPRAHTTSQLQIPDGGQEGGKEGRKGGEGEDGTTFSNGSP